jgi:DNA-binding FadR family transcriptional regulator
MIEVQRVDLRKSLDSDILQYIVQNELEPGDRIPSLSELSAELNISVSKLREQLEVARCLGVVEVRPRTGIRYRDFDLMPALRLTLFFGLANDRRVFDLFSNLRIHVEAAYWYEATALLQPEDKAHLRQLIARAWAMLRGDQIHIPHQEHRSFHMGIFARLGQPFVKAILETYWEAYEAVEFNRYADIRYLEEVWTYHERIVDHIEANEFDASLEAFIEHTQLLRHQSPIDPIPAENYGAITIKGKM